MRVDAGLIPVKRLDQAKSRLGLDAPRRRRVALAMFEDVLDLASGADFLSWWVVTGDGAAAEIAEKWGVGVLLDAGDGLNAALASSAAELARRGARSVSVIPADVPLASRDDLVDILDTGATSDVVVVPSATGEGTNALYVDPPGAIDPRFGEGSLGAHVRAADERGLRCSILGLARLEIDVDTPEDAARFLDHPGALRTRAGRVLGEVLRNGPAPD